MQISKKLLKTFIVEVEQLIKSHEQEGIDEPSLKLYNNDRVQYLKGKADTYKFLLTFK